MAGFVLRLFAVAGLVTALSAGGAASAMAESVLTRGNGAEPATLDPHATDGRAESNIFRDLFEGLVVYGPSGQIMPGMAEAWDISADGLSYTFHLRATAKWSNGTPVTAEDFVYSLRRAVTPRPGSEPSANLRVIRNAEDVMSGERAATELGVEAPNPLTLKISLRGPTPYFLALLSADDSALPVNRAAVEAHPDHWAEPGAMISNGPYQLAEWLPNQQITLVRNPHYYGTDAVKIDKVVFLPIANASEELKLFKEDKIDMTNEVPQEQVRWISLTNPHEFWNKSYLATYYYAFNLMAEPFKGNLPLRKALAMAVNRDALVEKVTRAGELPAYSLVPPTVPGYKRQSLPFIEQTYEQRLEEARKLFAESGYSPAEPLTIELLYNTSDNNRRVADAITEMWSEAFGKGIIVSTVNTNRSEYLQRRARRQFQIVRAAWIGDYADATVFLNLMLSQASPPRNDAGYANPAYDGLLAAAAVAVDPVERAGLLQNAERLMLSEYAIIPIYHYATKSLVKERVKGMTFNLRDVHPTRFLRLAD